MLSFIKFLKIALPVATVTSATIATTFLVSSSRNDLSNKGKEEDSILTDFVNLVEDFQEKKLFYAKQGDGDGTVALGEEESEKLQKLIDQGADINNIGNRSDSVPDASGTPSPKFDVQPQGDQALGETSESRDGIIQVPSAKEHPTLDAEKNNEASDGLESAKQEGNLDDDSDQKGKQDHGDSKDGKVEDKEQKDQSLSGQGDVEKEDNNQGDSQVGESNLEGKQPLQQTESNGEDGGDSGISPENSHKDQTENDSPQTQDPEETNNPETGNDVSKDESNTLEGKKEGENPDRVQESKGTDEAAEGSTNQHQGSKHGDSLGNSDETKVNLEELQKLEGELGSARDALNDLLSRL